VNSRPQVHHLQSSICRPLFVPSKCNLFLTPHPRAVNAVKRLFDCCSSRTKVLCHPLSFTLTHILSSLFSAACRVAVKSYTMNQRSTCSLTLALPAHSAAHSSSRIISVRPSRTLTGPHKPYRLVTALLVDEAAKRLYFQLTYHFARLEHSVFGISFQM
jgi:hypothetical protein